MLIKDNEKIVVGEVEVEMTSAIHHHVIVKIEEIDQMIEENLKTVKELI